ncbi:MAG: sugar phosphate isomerase/epimerase family protein [bacterium]
MTPCLSLVTICETPIPAAIEAAAQAGFTHVDFWWPALRQYLQQAGPQPILDTLAEKQVAIASISGLGLELAGSGQLWQESLANFTDFMQAIAPFAIPIVNFTPGITHELPPAGLYETAIERLLELKSFISSTNIILAMEFRSDSRWLTSLETAVALMDQLADPQIGLCLDLFHFMTGPSKTEGLTRLAIRHIRSAHVSDLIATPRELARDTDRILPGEGDFDIRGLLTLLYEQGFSGPASVDVPNPLLWQIPADRVSDMAFQALWRSLPVSYLEKQLQSSGRGFQESP